MDITTETIDAPSPADLIAASRVSRTRRRPHASEHLFGPGGRSEAMRVLLTWEQGPLVLAKLTTNAHPGTL
jgi:hypothetical protein